MSLLVKPMKWSSYLEIRVKMAFNMRVFRNCLNYVYLARKDQ